MSSELPDEQQEPRQRIDAYLDYLKRSIPSTDNYTRVHQLGILLSLCRAHTHGRMTPEQKQRHRGVLRKFKRMIAELQCSGESVSPLVLGEVEEAQSSKSR